MKIINPSYKIYMPHGTSENEILKHIEFCGRICYQSRDKITTDSAKKFVGRVKKLGHDSVLEMANIVLKIWRPLPCYWNRFNSPYVQASLDPDNPDIAYFSGSPRAFLEVLEKPKPKRTEIARVLQEEYPFLFGEFLGSSRNSEITVTCLSTEQIAALPWEVQRVHCKVAVEFTVNRAFSHQVIRHRISSYLQESQRYCRYKDDVVFIAPRFAKGTEAYRTWEDTMRCCEAAYLKLLETETPQDARTVLPNSVVTHIICYTSIEQWEHILEQRCSNACDPNMYVTMRKLREDFKIFVKSNFGHDVW